MSRSGIMLCYPFEENRLKKWIPPYIVQPKLDGDRCRAIIDSEGKATLLSSEENEIRSVPHINAYLEGLHLHSIELDGELYIHGAPHSDIHGIVSRTQNLSSDYDLVEYHVFDLVSLLSQIDRMNMLLDTIPCKKTGPVNSYMVQVVPNRIAFDLSDVLRAFDSYITDGYEGIIVRNYEAPYVRKRSTSIMKFKPKKEDIYEIVGVAEEISIEGIPKNSLGALICRGDDGTRFNVGSGPALTKDGRQRLWMLRESIPGKWARVKYQHITSAGRVPRFPVIIEIIDNIL